MIIPVKCFTCGKVLADLYLYYKREVGKIKHDNNDNIVYATIDSFQKSPEAEVLDKLQLTKICCRRHMLTHVDIE